jgi:HK97 family phage major capsid protein
MTWTINPRPYMDTIIRRSFTIDTTRAAGSGDTVPAVLSTDAPVDMGDMVEVLDHSAGAVDLSRFPLPLTEAHSNDATALAVAEDPRLEGGKLRATVRFGSQARAREILADVRAGIVRSLSISYSRDEIRPEGPGRVRTVKWTPLHVSPVGAPADTGAGFFRAAPHHTDKKGSPVSTENNPAGTAGTTTTADRSAAMLERERIANIRTICKQYRAPDSLAERAVSEGWDTEKLRLALLDMIDARGKAGGVLTDRGPDIDRTPEGGRFSLLRLLGALANPADRNAVAAAEYEMDTVADFGRRSHYSGRGVLIPLEALSTGKRAVTDSAAGAGLIGTDLMAGDFVSMIRDASMIASLGARIMPGLIGDASLPRMTAGASAHWFGGDGADSIPEDAAAFDGVTLSPKFCGGLLTLSYKLLKQSAPSVEQEVRRDLAAMLAEALDAAAIAGTGASNQPRGVLNTPGVNAVNFAAALPNLADLVALEDRLAEDGTDRGRLAYLCSPAVRTHLKTTVKFSGTDAVIWEGTGTDMVGDRRAGRVNGLPAMATKHVTPNAFGARVILGDWSSLLVGTWGGVEIATDAGGDNFARGSLAVRAILTTDCQVKRATAFAVGAKPS